MSPIDVNDGPGHAMHAAPPVSPDKLVVVDDHPLFREALSGAIKKCLPDCEVQAVSSFEKLQALLAEWPDLHSSGNHGLSGLAGCAATIRRCR